MVIGSKDLGMFGLFIDPNLATHLNGVSTHFPDFAFGPRALLGSHALWGGIGTVSRELPENMRAETCPGNTPPMSPPAPGHKLRLQANRVWLRFVGKYCKPNLPTSPVVF